MSEDRYRYSTKNIKVSQNFKVEDIFMNLGGCEKNLSKEFIENQKAAINKNLSSKMQISNQALQFYYSYYNEFMTLDDFLEFYHKFLGKRKMDMEKLRYKQKFMNEVENIKQIKTKRFLHMESLKMGRNINPEERL